MKSFSPLFFLFALLALLSTVTAAVVVGLKDVSWPKGWTTTMTVSAEETDATVTASPGTTTVFREMDPGRMTKIASRKCNISKMIITV